MRFNAQATTMMKTPDTRNANSVETWTRRNIVPAPHALERISLCLSSPSEEDAKLAGSEIDGPCVRDRAHQDLFPDLGTALPSRLGLPGRHAQLDATACGAGENLERKHGLHQPRPFSHEEFPPSRRPPDPERLDSNRAHHSVASDATVST